ncbi:hypothetical protein LTR95_015250 [Oleoguttula sp. CCFEE 5521]
MGGWLTCVAAHRQLLHEADLAATMLFDTYSALLWAARTWGIERCFIVAWAAQLIVGGQLAAGEPRQHER